MLASLLLRSKLRQIQSKTLSPFLSFSTQNLSSLFLPRQRSSNGAIERNRERNNTIPLNSTSDSKSVGKKRNDAIFPRRMSPEMASFLRRLKEEDFLKERDFYYEKPVIRNWHSLCLLKSATNQFGLKHQPSAKWLSGHELKQVALFGCPSVGKRTVMSAKRLRAFFRIKENTVCESCKINNSCKFVNRSVARQEKVILTDVTRVLIFYALNGIPQELSLSKNLKLSVNKLLNQVITLSR